MTELTTQQLADRYDISRERVGQLHREGRLTHKPRRIKQGNSAYIYLWPSATRRRPKGKPGRPKGSRNKKGLTAWKD